MLYLEPILMYKERCDVLQKTKDKLNIQKLSYSVNAYNINV